MSRSERLNARPLFWLGYFLVFSVVTMGAGQLLSRGIITGPWLVGIAVLVAAGGVLLAQFVVLPRLTRKPSPYPRITSTDTWESSLTPDEALERIRGTLRRRLAGAAGDALGGHGTVGHGRVVRRGC